jgi:tetratricopeptide (TPR) repeat protein
MILSVLACALILFASASIALGESPADRLYNTGMELQKSGRLDRALESYAEALRRNPRHFNALLARAELYFSKADYRQAADAFRDLLAFFPKDRRARLHLGEALLKMGSAEKAKDVFRKLLILDPDNVAALIGLGRAEFQAGNRFAAVETLKKAAGLDPKNESIHTSIETFQNANREYLKMAEEARRMRIKSALNNSIAESAEKARAERLRTRRIRKGNIDAARRQMVIGTATGGEEGEKQKIRYYDGFPDPNPQH